MNFDPNDLFYEMVSIYNENKPKNGVGDKVVICNEGGSRSSKTFDFFHFLDFYCSHNQNKKLNIYVLRDTLKNCREHTFKDFKECITDIIKDPNISYRSENSSPYANLYGNNIYFRGLDIDTESYKSDVLFFNEALEMNKEQIDGLVMRCEKLCVFDWNPKFTIHWCFNMEGQPNTFFTHSVYTDNKHLKESVINNIEQYCPWLMEDMHLPEKERRPNLFNIKNQTADEYRWRVYGEGMRAAPEGLIFQYANYIDYWPEDVGYSYGIDFGFTVDPFAMVKYGETKNDIFIELLCYHSIETPEAADLYMKEIGINKMLPITADSADKYTGENKGTVEMVVSLRSMGWKITKVSKVRSVMYWLTSMKQKKIHIINNNLVDKAKEEQQNYRMKVIHGIAINQPEDKFNHMWDSARYSHMAFNIKSGIKSRKG